ncbi:hypothetical protein E3O65_15370 [Cryobacterium breve]|uniref:FtsK domain-containing protein n=1 Tax=Cryobacterium breve TaxID=1259258 RepID=A0ABY2IV94_9MICO|nr:hypothetical protein E3O65_15370 [Cryobacterium breve]
MSDGDGCPELATCAEAARRGAASQAAALPSPAGGRPGTDARPSRSAARPNWSAGAVIRADVPLTLPVRPADPPRPRFPLVASLAPLAAAGVIWLITGSAFVLIFAVLGPVIAMAGMVDSRRTGRRSRRAAEASEKQDLGALRAEVTLRHEQLRRLRWQRTPSANDIVRAPHASLRGADAGSRVGAGGSIEVSLGSGAVPSGLRLDGGSGPDDHRALRDWAATLSDAPIGADAGGGIGIVGPLAIGRALARGLLVQLACALPPDQVTLCVPGSGWAWAAGLPHDAGPNSALRVVVYEASNVGETPGTAGNGGGGGGGGGLGEALVVALARSLDELPWGCDTIVRVQGPSRAEVLRSGEHAWGTTFRPELITEAQALWVAGELSARAGTAGLVRTRRSIPASVSLGELSGHLAGGGPRYRRSAGVSLNCVIGVGERGEVSLDLVAAGPHAVIGGTTGSGKSELLVTWVAAMAAAAGPAEVTFLLVDFKGGAAFAPLRSLPHCVGLITDLDGRQAARALDSLAAELTYRERVLRQAGARDIVDLAVQNLERTLPRLVIVVDEFATMLTAFPELHALFVDVAARGRSLGVHLILCTQRPTGVVRDALLANCTLRLSLRVNNRADSVAVLGTDAAAALSAEEPGRCLIAASSSVPLLCQVATTSVPEIRAVAERHGSDPALRRPWLDPLPAGVTRDGLLALVASGTAVDETTATAVDAAAVDATAVNATRASGSGSGSGSRRGTDSGPGCLLGLLDEPELQRYRVARYAPGTDGSLLVIGGGRSGKSSVLDSIAAQYASVGTVDRPGGDIESVWDALVEARHRLEAGGSPATRLLMLDDFDSVHARWDQEYRPAALELLAGLLRDGAEAGLRIVVAAQRLTGSLQALSALCHSRLVLRLPDLTEHVAVGGVAALFDPRLPPGGGSWQGHRIQLLQPDRHEPKPEALLRPGPAGLDPATFLGRPGRTLLVVSGAPARAAASIGAVPGMRVVDLAAVYPAAATAAGVLPDGAPLRLAEAETATVFVGDVDAWQAQWSLLGALRRNADLVFDGCSLADYRAISRRRDLPPPLAPGRGRVWVLQPDGTVQRSTLRPPRLGPGRTSH